MSNFRLPRRGFFTMLASLPLMLASFFRRRPVVVALPAGDPKAGAIVTDGRSPLFVVDTTTRGTGKTRLVQATVRPASSQPEDEIAELKVALAAQHRHNSKLAAQQYHTLELQQQVLDRYAEREQMIDRRVGQVLAQAFRLSRV